MSELKDTISRNAGTLAQDFAALGALVVTLIVGLSLPGLF